MAELSHYTMQVGSFFILVAVQSTAILLFKLCQVGGAYTFSPASSVALTEVCKLALAASMHHQQVQTSGKAWFAGVNQRIVVHYFALSLLYTINNQLSFYVLEVADPGSMSLGKSVAPYLCALLLRLTGQPIQQLQWVCIVVQCCAIAIVQYDACKDTGILPYNAYVLIATATAITATTSVWNQLIIKTFDVPVNLQNAIMYSFGSVIALCFYTREPHSRHEAGFFGGYTPLAYALVLFQAFHGLAVALVYKYADAIVKNFANSAVMAILVVISAYFFALSTTAHSWLGIVIVLATTFCYMNIALKAPPPPAAKEDLAAAEKEPLKP
jgi:UDP-sugar transporter A1/2/3